MIIAVPRETDTNEARVSTTPHSAAELIKAGYTVKIESGAGDNSFFSDNDYQNVDVKIISSKEELFSGADIIIKVTPPSKEEISLMAKGTVCISFSSLRLILKR